MSTSNKHVTKKYFIQGMHCAACELLIKQEVSAISGVSEAKVSLADSTLIVSAKSDKKLPNVQKLNSLFKPHGYSFYENETAGSKLPFSDVAKIAVTVLVFVLSFSFLEKTGFFRKFSVTPDSSFFSYFLFGIAAGLSSCAALVGGILLALSKNWNAAYRNDAKKSALPFIYFNLSRIIAFALFGGLLGLLGSFIALSFELLTFLAIIIALLMVVVGFQMIGIRFFQQLNFNFIGTSKYLNKNEQLSGKYIPLVVGALTFLVPCGFTLIAQANALATGSFASGALALFAFSLGTLPTLALISFTSIKFFSDPAFSKKFSVFAGFLIIFFAFYTLNSQLNVLGLPSLNDLKLNTREQVAKTLPQKALVDQNGYQTMQMEATAFAYSPSEIIINANTKTKWEIYNSGTQGCASAVYAKGLYQYVIYLKPGLNTVEFVSPKPGFYKVSCSMGMVPPITVKVI